MSNSNVSNNNMSNNNISNSNVSNNMCLGHMRLLYSWNNRGKEGIREGEKGGNLKSSSFIVQISLKAHGTLHDLPPGIGIHSFTVLSAGGESSTSSPAVAIHATHFSFHLVPITAGWPEAVWIQSLPKAFTHQNCGNRTQDPLISDPMP